MLKTGTRTRFIEMPWTLKWYRTSYLLKDGISWYDEILKSSDRIHSDEFKKGLWQESFKYRYTLKSGEIQDVVADVSIIEREWRIRLFFPYLKLEMKTSRVIEVEFSSEVGEGAGDWKGGVIGCSYELLPGETAEECLRRMEKERKFNR